MILIQLRTSRHYAETWPKAPVGCQTGDAQIGVCVRRKTLMILRSYARLRGSISAEANLLGFLTKHESAKFRGQHRCELTAQIVAAGKCLCGWHANKIGGARRTSVNVFHAGLDRKLHAINISDVAVPR